MKAKLVRIIQKAGVFSLIFFLLLLSAGCDPYSEDFREYKEGKEAELRAYAVSMTEEYSYSEEGLQAMSLAVEEGVNAINNADYYVEVDELATEAKDGIDRVEVKLDYNAEKLLFALNRATDVSELKESFLNENRTSGMINNRIPEYKIHVVTEQQQLESIFVESPEVNFESEMVLVVMYKSWVSSKWHLIRKIELEENVLRVYTRDDTTPYMQGTISYQVIFIFKLDKLDVAETELIFLKEEKIS
ncbi:MAG: hypothetical protein PHG90_02710 [Clostridia bacterium]|nr:hypothetical protein [Clostridia bacterium]NLT18782.1 hypothetical protein [Clostridiales bacterium]OQC12857.1 MAG: hypothetical protein BWX72_01846 [Firmicutes bacterium ADurb.Bin080]